MKCNKRAAATLKRWAKRNFTKEGLRNRKAFERQIQMDSMKNVAESDVSAMAKDLSDAVTEAYGVRLYRNVPEADLEKVNDYIAGLPVNLPLGLAPKINHLRAYIDRLSRGMMSALQDMMDIQYSRMTDAQQAQFRGFLAGTSETMPKSMVKNFELYQTINSNIGTYLTRSYAAFDDKNWKEKALENTELIERAEDYIASLNEDLSSDEVTGLVRSILQSAKDQGSFVGLISKGQKVGSKDASILKKKKDVPEIIRELLGEHKDPKINFVMTATKLSWYLANHHYLMKLRKDGLGVFLFEKPTDVFDTKISTEGSESMNPLNGMYTTEDFRTGMEDAMDNFDGSDLMRTIISINSMVKYGKTIISPTTQARNFMSASMFSIANGHFNWTHGIKALKVAKSDLFTKDEVWRAYLTKLIGMGVLHDNPYSGELRDALRDVSGQDPRTFGPQRNMKSFLSFMQKLYQVGDDFWKIIGFENEVTIQLRTGLSRMEAEKKAAYRIRNGYPTYSMVPRGIKKIRRWPLIGTFVSFPYEIVRTSYNQAQFIKEDIAAGNKEAAARRVLGFSIAAATSYAVSIYSMMLLGMDSDDDEAVRAQLPPWSRNSQLFYVGYDENGMLQYLDLSYLDPYTYLKTPITAILNGNNEGIDDKIADALIQFLDPFIGGDIAATAIGEVIFNKNAQGMEIYNIDAPLEQRAENVLGHIRKAIQPGVMSNIERTTNALTGYTSRSGRQYTIKDEGLAWVGFRFGTLNLSEAMIYNGYDFNDRKSNATQLLSNVAGSLSDVSDKELKKAVSTMVDVRKSAYGDMSKLVKGSLKLGMTEDVVHRSLSASGIGDNDIEMLIEGIVPRWEMSPHFLDRVTKRAAVSSKGKNVEEIIERRKMLIEQYFEEEYTE